MKLRSLYLTSVFSLVLNSSMGGICFADNAAKVDLQVSCPSGNEYVTLYNGPLTVIDESMWEYYVNVHVSLLDNNDLPATAGPDGEDLSSVTAELTTELGIAGSIVPDEFLSDTSVLHFGGEPVAVAHIRYACTTSCIVGDDAIEVEVGGLSDSAEVEVKAPDAHSIVMRLCGDDGCEVDELFEADPGQQKNGRAKTRAGGIIPFEVIALEENSGHTFAPNLEGEEVTVYAFADYSGDNKIKVVDPPDASYEPVPVAEATAEFLNGKAMGNVEITKAGTKDKSGNAAMRVVFTATTGVNNSAGDRIETKQATVDIDSDTDSDIDYALMVPGRDSKLIIGRDPFDTGNLIEEIDYWYVLDDETQYGGPRTNQMAVFVADSFGNPVTFEVVVVSSEISNSLLSVGVTDEENGWDITLDVRSNDAHDGLAVAWNNVRNEDVPKGGGPIKGTITLKDDFLSLEEDSATVYLVRAGSGNYDVAHPFTGANLLDLHVDTDHAGISVTAGDTVMVYLTDVNGSAGHPTSQGIVEIGDEVTIYAHKYDFKPPYYSGAAYLISGDSQSYDNAVTTGYTHRVTSSNVGSKGEIIIPIKIWGHSKPTDIVPERRVIISVADVKKGVGTFPDPDYGTLWKYPPGNHYGAAAPQYDLDHRWITELKPAEEATIKIAKLSTWVFAENEDLEADPIVITSQFETGLDYTLLTDASVDTADAYGNIVNDEPFYGTGISDGIGAVWTADRVTTIKFDEEDIGQTATIIVGKAGLPDRHLQIINIIKGSAELVCGLEGPEYPSPKGEAIIWVGVSNTFSPTPRNIQVGIDEENSVPGSELRDLTGVVLTSPTTKSLDSGSIVRLAASAPEKGDVALEIGDASGDPTLLDTGKCTIHFGPPCTPVVTVTPASADLEQGETQQFTASTSCIEGGNPSNTPVYTWEISAGGGTDGTATACSGSTISANGLYTAPESVSTGCGDTVKATDTANGDAEGTANVTMGAPVSTTTTSINGGGAFIDVKPDTIKRSRTRTRTALLRIRGDNTNFSRDSLVSVSPAGEVELGVKLRLSKKLILQAVRVLPGEAGETITVTVTTGTEVGSDYVTIEMK